MLACTEEERIVLLADELLIRTEALLVTVLGEIPDQVAALKEIYQALKPGGILSITEVIFDPHFQRRENVLHSAQATGFKEKDFFGRQLAYNMHLEKTKA